MSMSNKVESRLKSNNPARGQHSVSLKGTSQSEDMTVKNVSAANRYEGNTVREIQRKRILLGDLNFSQVMMGQVD